LMALHDYLCQNNDLTKLAILLGMSATKRGSRDTNIIKVLSIHVDALLPPNSTELDVSAPVHAASIIGVGLLYQSSGDSHISRVLLDEIGRLPGPEANSHVDRESYSLSAGLAFGLVNLCKGGSITISSSDQLRLYMLGGKRKPLTATQKERYFKQDCHRGEEEYINTHITSPGGTLGLGLMYHRSGNESVANWMRAPDTQTLLEYVRPDFLILRMLSYGLIMWDQIEPSEEYINKQMPKIVAQYAFRRNPSPTQTDSVANPAATHSNDYELISQSYCNIIAGCCMAIAMKYAGTADTRAYETIHKHTKMLIMLGNKPALAEQAGRPCIESCLNVLVTSLAVVMAGTGDLGVMRVCRYLRSRLTQSCVFYGSYMAIHTALGILFLGACRYSLSRSPESIGALVCALYPIYPNHSADNRYHLQALRHLYVLAAEPRLLIPKDISTNKPVYVNITVNRRGENGEMETLKLRAPCLMPEVESIESVHIDDDRYWRIEIKNKNALKTCLSKGYGFLSVKQKAHTSNNQLVQNIEHYILQNMTRGVMKCRKTSALTECVKEDRVVQYSALNELLTNSHKVDIKFRSLILEQLRLAITLSKDGDMADKINLLKPLVGEYDDEIGENESEKGWIDFISGKRDWTNASAHVAYMINLHGLKCADVDEDLVQSLVELGVS
jgi:anaphase-promoting complex subunit 1